MNRSASTSTSLLLITSKQDETFSRGHKYGHVLLYTLVHHYIYLFSAKTLMLNQSLDWYKEIITTCVDLNRTPVHILQYDRLQSNLAAELRMLAEFLNVTVSNNDIQCTVQLQEGHVHRRTSLQKRLEQMHTVFNDDDMFRLRTLQTEVESILKKRFNETIDLSGIMGRQQRVSSS